VYIGSCVILDVAGTGPCVGTVCVTSGREGVVSGAPMVVVGAVAAVVGAAVGADVVGAAVGAAVVGAAVGAAVDGVVGAAVGAAVVGAAVGTVVGCAVGGAVGAAFWQNPQCSGHFWWAKTYAMLDWSVQKLNKSILAQWMPSCS